MADASKKKIIDLRKIFEDEDYDLAAENQGWYCQQLQCKNLQGAWETLGNYTIKQLANGAQNLSAGYWFLAQIVPKVTGYSMFVLPDDAGYRIPLFDNTYPQNHKALPEGEWKAAISGGKFEGFKNYGWTPTLEYKGPGNRTPVGSVAKGIADCIGFINELIERDMLDGEKW